MCFSKSQSYVMFFSCIFTAFVNIYYKASWKMYVPILFLSIKELIQAQSYTVVDKCDSKYNKFLTILSWIHISFQPVFVNIFFSAFHKDPNVYDFTIKLCLVASLFLLSKLYVNNDKIYLRSCPYTNKLVNMCRKSHCTVSGEKHIAYGFYLREPNAFTPNIFLHMFLIFVPSILLDNYILSLCFLITGPLLSTLILKNKKKNLGEIAAIWCNTSITMFVFSLIKLRRFTELFF